MKHSGTTGRAGRTALCIAIAAVALAACSKQAENADDDAPPVAAANAGAAAPAAGAPPAASTDTVSGATLASFTGNPTSGEAVFVQCKTCHEVTPGVNKIGPSLAGVVGRKASSIAGFTYSPANHNSGITWTKEKLFQYLENPQRVVPGTKMAFAGIPDPQKRADVIAYLAAH